eukprot:Colp12_sorted_trinity150504_noHs@22626
MEEARLGEAEKEEMRKSLAQKESDALRMKRSRIDRSHFTSVKIIGQGGFGEVRLVKEKSTGDIFAMKIINKNEMLARNEFKNLKAERNLLSEAESDWIVRLHYSFQDADNLYMVMDFCVGSDMLNLLIKYEVFPEAVGRFYIAEILLGLEYIHSLGYVHRDLKPDNVLIDASGHLKLTDFGLSSSFSSSPDSKFYNSLTADELDRIMPLLSKGQKRKDSYTTLTHKDKVLTWKQSRRQYAMTIVGTPDYMAPEVFEESGYGKESDYWSLGVLLYEMIVGFPPFCVLGAQRNARETAIRIQNWRTTFRFPEECTISDTARHFLQSLITDASLRLGKRGAAEIKAHPFFRTLDFNRIRDIMPPFVPEVDGITDTRYFESEHDIIGRAKFPAKEAEISSSARWAPNFAGYTFKKGTKVEIPDVQNMKL